MAESEVFTGARAVLKIGGSVVGVFSRASYSIMYDVAPAFVLGRYAAAELTYVGAEPVSVDAVGFRLIDNGAHVQGKVPKLQDLLNHNSIELEIVDRETSTTILKVIHVRPVGYSSDIAARSQVEMSIRFVGIRAEDESGPQSEPAGSVATPGFP